MHQVSLSKVYESESSPLVTLCFLHTGSSQLAVYTQENSTKHKVKEQVAQQLCLMALTWPHSLSVTQKDGVGEGQTRVAFEMFNSH